MWTSLIWVPLVLLNTWSLYAVAQTALEALRACRKNQTTKTFATTKNRFWTRYTLVSYDIHDHLMIYKAIRFRMHRTGKGLTYVQSPRRSVLSISSSISRTRQKVGLLLQPAGGGGIAWPYATFSLNLLLMLHKPSHPPTKLATWYSAL